MSDEAARLAPELAEADPEALARAVAAEAAERRRALLAGIAAYHRHPYRRDMPEPPTVWRDGTTRLVDFGGAGPPVLVVPSLVNRWTILDLMPGRSFLRALGGAGLHPFVVDWGAPGADERRFGLDDYILGRLGGALDRVVAATGRRPGLLGYCMGGLLAAALAARRTAEVGAVAALATPWDFHAERPELAGLAAASLALLEPALELHGELPVDAIQSLFFALDPLQVAEKFRRFAAADQGSPRAALYVAVEDWANDGVPLAAPVARECLAGWYGANAPARGRWRIGDAPVDAARLDLPLLCVLPRRDRIVPPRSAAALADAVPGARRLEAAGGHIAMVVGDAAPAVVEALAAWFKRNG